MELLIFIVAFTAGALVGKMMTDQRWRENSDSPVRILSDGSFYKVILIPYLKSWELAWPHCRFPDVQVENKKGCPNWDADEQECAD